MYKGSSVYWGVILATILVASVASAQYVTNVVKSSQGMGVKIDWGTGAASQTYDKAYTRDDGTVNAGKAWIQFDVSNAWATYGQGNLVGATLTLWGENGTGRDFDVSGLADNSGLENWNMHTLTWNNAPANVVTNGSLFDWSKVYGGSPLWLGRGNGVDLARPDLGNNFDQCARYTSPDISAFLKTDTDGKVTFMWSGSNNQNWWVGTNGTYANDINLGYTSTNTANGTYGEVIRDSPTLTLLFAGGQGTPGVPVFTKMLYSGNDIILQGTNGPHFGTYEVFRSSNLNEPQDKWQDVGGSGFDAAGNFSFTNALTGDGAGYYRLAVSSTGPVAFPGAEGYGKYATGGRGGVVYEVTNLNATGPGSLAAAIDASGPRTVVFRVGGIITNDFDIRNGDITIAGQTAPGDGICIKGSVLVSANNVIIRYIRCRPNTTVEPQTDAIGGRFQNNIIFDHISASWSGDETMSLYHNSNVTIQWCLIAEACAKFINGTNTGHQFGGIWGNNPGTYTHNLIADNVSRNVRWASGCGYNDYRNNVIYNWDYNSCYGGEAMQDGATNQFSFTTVNMVANYYKAGPATRSGVRRRIADPSVNAYGVGSWYVADNYVDGYPSVTVDNWLGVDGTNYIKMSAPWNAMPVNQQTPEAAYTNVLAGAGCSFPQRDSVDATIVQDAANGTATYGDNGIFTYPTDGGGWPVYANGTPPVDNNHNGVPDSWETAHGLNLNTPSDVNEVDPTGQGYTYLEEYLNSLVPPN